MSIVPRQNLLPRNNAHLAMDDYRSIKDLLGIVIVRR
jgi:hypothetical protein